MNDKSYGSRMIKYKETIINASDQLYFCPNNKKSDYMLNL